MKLDDLEWQFSNYGGLPPRTVGLLLEGGHLDLVIEAARERGEWFCAEAAVRELCGAGEFERAWAVLEPFVAVGWREAVWLRAEILLQWGRVDEALELVRPDEEGRRSGRVCRDFAELLVRAGRVDEAIDVLAPHVEESWLLSSLVEMTEGQGRDERILELIAPLAERVRRARAEGRCHDPAWEAQALQARVLERAGRADEAIRILGEDVAARRYLVQNTVTAYAELLARQGRIGELRALGTGEHATTVLGHYAKALEDLGRVDEAEAVLREFIDATDHPGHRGVLVDLLSRQGRIDDAVEVGRPTFEYFDCGNHLEWIVDLLIEDGRPERALELLDGLGEKYVEEHSWWVRPTRLRLLGEAGRLREALAEAAALPADEYAGQATVVAWLLEQDGRVEEAADLLRTAESGSPWQLAELLIGQGRPAEAIAAMPAVSAQREEAIRRQEAARPREGYEPPF
ncbi:tetratricopeptide repeat protein [Streptomyces sp. MN13]